MDHNNFFKFTQVRKLTVRNMNLNMDAEEVNWLHFKKDEPEHILLKYALDEETFRKINVIQRGLCAYTRCDN
jgi:hypothetical protein